MQIPTSDELQEAREKRGLTQAELARKAGVSQPLIARIESGDVDTTIETMHELVAPLNGSDSNLQHDEIEVTVQSALKDARKRTGLTQGELAEKADVSQPLISRIESQDLNPRVSTLRSLLEHLDPIPNVSSSKGPPKNRSLAKTKVLKEIQSDFEALQQKKRSREASEDESMGSKEICNSCGQSLEMLSDPDFCPGCGTRI